MRTKTYYSEQPSEFSVVSAPESVVVVICENIEEVETEDGTQYRADEYRMTVKKTAEILSRIQKNKDLWIERIKMEDYNAESKKVREKRDVLLSASDWTQVPDNPLPTEKKMAWAEYRQSLRDIPEQEGFPYDVVFPDEPR